MTILIHEHRQTDTHRTIDATCGKRRGVVSIFSTGGKVKSVSVVCLNAAHRAWRGGGRTFATVADALSGYRSAEMRAIIETAAGKGV